MQKLRINAYVEYDTNGYTALYLLFSIIDFTLFIFVTINLYFLLYMRYNNVLWLFHFALTEQTVNKELELYSTEALYLTVDNETATVDYYISYIEENIN